MSKGRKAPTADEESIVINADEENISINAGVGLDTGQPFVELIFGKASVKMHPEQSREIAMHLLRAAEAAEADAFLCHFVHSAGEFSEEQIGCILYAFRQYRNTLQEPEESGMTTPTA